jgi:xanthine/uracil permease
MVRTGFRYRVGRRIALPVMIALVAENTGRVKAVGKMTGGSPAVTRVYSTVAYWAAAGFALLFGLCPKFVAIVAATTPCSTRARRRTTPPARRVSVPSRRRTTP